MMQKPEADCDRDCIVPQWINITNTTEASHKHGRVVNEVSLALPHVGVVNAVHDQRNQTPIPATSDSIKPYSLWASVPWPVINFLCVHMNETELSSIVYSQWPNNENVNATTWEFFMPNATTTNSTVVDDLFGWVKKDKRQWTYMGRLPILA